MNPEHAGRQNDGSMAATADRLSRQSPPPLRPEDVCVGRRAFSLATLLVAVLGGCAIFNRQSDIDIALEELDAALEPLLADDERVAALAEPLEQRVRSLAAAHRDFNLSFDELARNRDTEDGELLDLVTAYEGKRVAARRALLESQVALLEALPDEARGRVSAVLNQNTAVLAPTRGAEG